MYIFFVFYCAIVVSLVISLVIGVLVIILMQKIFDFDDSNTFAICLLVISFIPAMAVTYIHFLEQN